MSLAGCYHAIPLEISARDATSHEPLSGVRIQSGYPHMMDPFAPREAMAVTNAAGEAQLPIVLNYNKGGTPYLYFEHHLLDRDMPTAVLALPVNEYRRQYDSATRAGKPVGPAHLTVDLLSRDEHSRKYGQ
jgi:hypothetical protein